jgi:hypothetical protein
LIAHAQAVRPARPTPPREKASTRGFLYTTRSRSHPALVPPGQETITSLFKTVEGWEIRASLKLWVVRKSRVSEERYQVGTSREAGHIGPFRRITRHTPRVTRRN